MDARIEGQLGGVVHTIPTRGSSPPRSNADGARALPAQVFDANGDGAIEHWSYAHGGDSFATFKPPPSGAAGANLRRVGHAPPAAAPTAHATTAAAMHHAREAYQRDGGATGADALTARTATSAPVTVTATATAQTGAPGANAPARHMTQSAPTAALASTRS
jgi:hypothetical protein